MGWVLALDKRPGGTEGIGELGQGLPWIPELEYRRVVRAPPHHVATFTG